MFFTPPPLPPQPTTVVVWIRGTNPKQFLPAGIVKLTDEMTSYLFTRKSGLHKSEQRNLQEYSFLVRKALSEQTTSPLFSSAHFYAFGWEGKLTLENRKASAKKLYDALLSLHIKYSQQDGHPPQFILISHSHGGNVILHMAELEEAASKQFTIHKAILLACPVQKHTKHLINHAMFKRVYSLHSHTDIIQIADPQGFHIPKKVSFPLLSERHFNIHPKVAQVCICWKNGTLWHPEDTLINEIFLKKVTSGIKLLDKLKKKRGLLHIEFQLLPFLRQLPSLIDQLDKKMDNQQNIATSNKHDIIMYL